MRSPLPYQALKRNGMILLDYLSVFVFILMPFLWSGCRQNVKKQPVKIVAKHVVPKAAEAPLGPMVGKPLICLNYDEGGGYDPDKGTFSEYIESQKGYFKGKTSLSLEEARQKLFKGLDSIPIRLGDMDELTNYYLIGTVVNTKRFKGVIYEALSDRGSSKFFTTIDNATGKYIDRIQVADYDFAGTYPDDDGMKHPYYTAGAGCISKNLIIDLGGGDDGIYKVWPDGTIKKYMRFYYDSVLTVYPNNAAIRYKYAKYLTYQLQDNAGGKKQFEEVLRIDPKNDAVCSEYAYMLWNDFYDTTNARKYFQKAIELNSNNNGYRQGLAAFLNRRKEENRRIRGYEYALKRADSSNYIEHMDYAHFLAGIKRIKEGRLHYLKAVQLNPYMKSEKDDQLFEVK